MDLYKRIGSKAKKAYQNWNNDQKPPYEPLDDESESSTEKKWDCNPWSSRQVTPNNDARESQSSSENTDAFYAEMEKESPSKKKEETSFLAGYMAAAKLIEKEADDAREGKHKPNSRTDGAEGTSSYAHEMPGSSNQNISRERERKIDGTKPGLVGQGGQEQKLGVYFAPVIPCSTPKTNDLTNPALYKDCVIHNSQ